MTDDLRQRIADALTAAAHQCDGQCGLDERACYDAHPITWSAMAGGTTHIDGSVTAIADAAMTVLDDEAAERWIQQQLTQTGIRSMDFRNGMEMELEPARELLGHWVAAARAMLGDAPNYTETPVTLDKGETLAMDVKVAESPEMYTLTVQRHALGALTPHQARMRAEDEVEQLRAARARVRALHQPIQHMGQTWCGACSVRRRTGTKTEEWVAYIPHPCPTIDAIEEQQ